MANVFGVGAGGKGPQNHNGSFRADDLELTLPSGGGAGALVQQVQFQVQRAVNMLYEIGSNNVYYTGNRRQGTANLSRVVGSSDVFKRLLSDYGDMCNPKSLTMTAKGGCGAQAGGGVTYELLHATLTSVGASVTAQEIVVTEQLAFICSDIDVA